MSRSLKGGRRGRQKVALAGLEKQLAVFKAANQNKEAHESTRNGRKILHKGRSYEAEISRIEYEIGILKQRIAI